MEQQLYKMGLVVTELLRQLIHFAEEKELTNSQTLLNILDEVNELSIKY